MSNPNITTEEAALCLRLLQAATEPIVAPDLARLLGLAGSRETQRRHVRALIKHLRDICGLHIIATLWGGYLLTGDEQLWRDYNEGRQIDAKRILAVTHKRKKMIQDRAGQGFLFGQKVTVGIA